jgi:hypothetical protein
MFILSGYTLAFIFPKKTRAQDDGDQPSPGPDSPGLAGTGLPAAEPMPDVAIPNSEIRPPFLLHRYF